jgi:hypothetical protein
MKVCAVCGSSAPVSASSCSACGEGSWKPFVAPANAVEPVVEPKKTKRSKKASPAVVEPVAAPEEIAAASGEISDEDFAAEIAAASDVDLLTLMGEASAMPETWRTMLMAEIDKRGAQ